MLQQKVIYICLTALLLVVIFGGPTGTVLCIGQNSHVQIKKLFESCCGEHSCTELCILESERCASHRECSECTDIPVLDLPPARILRQPSQQFGTKLNLHSCGVIASHAHPLCVGKIVPCPSGLFPLILKQTVQSLSVTVLLC